MVDGNGTSGSSTRYASLSRRQASLVLAAFVVFTVWGVAISWRRQPKLSSGEGEGDLALYSHVVQRLSHGEGYYDSLGSELRAREYPTRSPFNWRTPLHLEILAHLPETAWGQYLLGSGALFAIGLAVAAPFRSGEYGLVIWQALLLGFPLAISGMYPVYFFAEMWTGVAISISVGLYAVGWRKLGAGTGVLALFFRELALPYVLIGLVLAWRQKKKSELWTWIAGLAAFSFYFGLHVMAVASRVPSSDHVPEVSRWIQFGGLRFLLITSRVGLLQLYPFWWAAIYLPCALLGLAGWRHPLAGRVLATVVAYLLAFSVIGIPSANYYWGAVYAPLLAFGTPWWLAAFKDLLWAVLPANWTAAPQVSVTEAAQ
jgi:hypothetical protein